MKEKSAISLNSEKNNNHNVEESPPILKSWPRLYTLVLVNLIFWLCTFYIIRRIFE